MPVGDGTAGLTPSGKSVGSGGMLPLCGPLRSSHPSLQHHLGLLDLGYVTFYIIEDKECMYIKVDNFFKLVSVLSARLCGVSQGSALGPLLLCP